LIRTHTTGLCDHTHAAGILILITPLSIREHIAAKFDSIPAPKNLAVDSALEANRPAPIVPCIWSCVTLCAMLVYLQVDKC